MPDLMLANKQPELDGGAGDAHRAARSDDCTAGQARVATEPSGLFLLRCRGCGKGFYEMLALLKHREQCEGAFRQRKSGDDDE
jgi:hypothetical protein